MSNHPSFRESQRFTQIWVWALLLIPAAVLLYNSAAQILLDRPWGDEPPSAGVLLAVNAVWFGIIFLFAGIRLHTKIDRHGITYRFIPFHQVERHIRWESVSGCSVEEFRYTTMYQFHGIRYRPVHGGWTYSIRGNQWIRIDMRNGKRIFIGTQKPGEVSSIIRRLRQ